LSRDRFFRVLVAWFSPDPPPVQAGFGYPTRVRHAVFARAFLSSMVLLRAFHRSPSRRCCVSSARDLGAVARARAVIFSVSIGAGSSCVQGNPSRSRFVVRWWLASKALDPSDYRSGRLRYSRLVVSAGWSLA
jgi:hypothetical protein